MSVRTADRVLTEACTVAGLTPDGAVLVREHGSRVYLLPGEQVIVRISRQRTHAATVMTVVRWLRDNGLPITTPAIDHPVHIDDVIATFWTYYPQHGRPHPPPSHLGTILRKLHSLPAPPIELPTYRPLVTFRDAVDGARCLGEAAHRWLTERAERLCHQYDQLETMLGIGLIHGDAYPGNTLWGPDGALLGDWDEVATGPRELDLVNTFQGVRFGRTEADLTAFSSAYGYDPRTWTGFATLCELRDLHTLTTFIRLAGAGDSAAATELHHRIDTLRAADTQARWNAQ